MDDDSQPSDDPPRPGTPTRPLAPGGDQTPPTTSPLKRPFDDVVNRSPVNPMKRTMSDSMSSPVRKRPRPEHTGGKWGPNGTPDSNGDAGHSRGGKNGPKHPLPELEEPREQRPKLFIPKVNSTEELRTPDDGGQVLVRFESATPNKPLFIDNDPSMGVDFPVAVNSPVPFPPSRQSSCNSLVRFSERLFEDGTQANTDDSLSLPDINDRAFQLERSPSSLSASSESSGIQMRNVETAETASDVSTRSEGFVPNPDTDSGTRETELSDKNQDSPSCLSDTQRLSDSERTLEESGEFVVSDFNNEVSEPCPGSVDEEIARLNRSSSMVNDDAVPSTSRSDPENLRTEVENDINIMFQQVQILLERFTNEGLKVDPNDIFLALERYRVAGNRMDIVYEEFILHKEESQFQTELHELQAQFHDINGEILRTLLEKCREFPYRKEKVIQCIKANSALVHDEVFLDVLHLLRIFPERDKMEVYAYLKAKQHEPKRVDIVAELLLQHRQDTLKTNDSSMEVGESELEFVEEVDSLQSIFPDADRDYLFEQLKMRKDDPNRKEKLAARMAELRTYTKVNERPKKGKKRKGKFILKEFVKTFPNAVEFFSDVSRGVNENYKRHARIYLLNYFTSITAVFIDNTLRMNGGHLTPTFKSIQDTVDRLSHDPGNYQVDPAVVFSEEPRTRPVPCPDVPVDELFVKEVQFLDHEPEITNYIQLLSREKQRAKEAARASGDLMECQCCYDDEVLFEDMQACEEGHLFCIQCIRMAAETNIGEGKSTFQCLSENCESQFPLTVLKQLLKPETLAKVLQRLQEEEVRLAGIENLVTCPFCPFATIMEDESDKVLRCRNPECLKESCRLCREPNHVPLTCAENQQDCTDLRTFVEKRISEAMIRTCHRCNKRYYKHDGCNKMTCACGGVMCYVCRDPDVDYDHFNDNDTTGEKCPLYGDIVALHKREMERAGRQAYDEFIAKHPEQAGKYNYEDLVRGVPSRREPRDEDEYDNEDEDEDEMDESDDNDYDDEREYHGDNFGRHYHGEVADDAYDNDYEDEYW